jgi:hypothetical protein
MTRLRRFLTLSFFLALSGYGVANAQGLTAGDYKLAVGHATPCAVSLAADGTATVPTDCAHVSDVKHWRSTATGVEFFDNAGSTVAVLKAKGDGYQGATFANNDQLTLTH